MTAAAIIQAIAAIVFLYGVWWRLTTKPDLP